MVAITQILKKLFLNKKFVILSIFIFLCLIIFYLFKKNENNIKEIDRLSNNQSVLLDSIKVHKAKNGDLVYSVQGLTIKNTELKMFNKDLVDDIKSMNIKLKNVSSITGMKYKYETVYDTITTEDIKQSISIKDKYAVINTKNNKFNFYLRQYKFDRTEMDSKSHIKGYVNVPIKKDIENNLVLLDTLRNPYLTNVEVDFKDELIIVPEIIYKRKYIFWKKPVAIRTNVKSTNKAFKLDQLYNYQLTK